MKKIIEPFLFFLSIFLMRIWLRTITIVQKQNWNENNMKNSNRTTLIDIKYQLDEINKKLKSKNYVINLGQRYNYYALDLYDLDMNLEQTLKTGLKKSEIYLYLSGFIKSYDLLDI